MRLPPSEDEVHSRLGEAWPVFGAVDCHAHVFEEGFPFAAGQRSDPRPYPFDYYLGWIRALRIARSVQVTASCYGFDNSATRYAIDECRANGVAARGVAIVHPEIEEAELAALARAGFIAARVMASRVAAVGIEAFDALARRCAPHRWHLEVNVDRSDAWEPLEPRLAASPVPVVFEHLGMRADEGPQSPGVHAVLRLLDKRRDFAVKLRFPDIAPVVQLFVRHHLDRLMWGSNLPQPMNGNAYGDLELIAAALEALPDAGARERVFAANAERFYGF
jgi:predicted TIM-barrel fold metal-dependent hydrolase